MYRRIKHYGQKTDRFKTVLGYITEEKVPRIFDMVNKKYINIQRGYVATKLKYFLLYRATSDEDWEILRSSNV